MRSLFRRTLTAERACRTAMRHLFGVCGVEYRVVAQQCRPIETATGRGYVVRCTAYSWVYDVAIASNGDVAEVDRFQDANAPAWPVRGEA